MLFDTPVFLCFLTIAVALYWSLSWRRQNAVLLVLSYFFYGWWDWRFLGLIWISTVVDYFCARAVARSDNPTHRKLLLTVSILLNAGFLGFFKYYDFFATSLQAALASVGVSVSVTTLNLILPPGISFYTFQALAYIVDVYFRKLEAAENFIDYALFISFFPHLIAGPIQRPGHLLPQTQKPRTFNQNQFFDGIQLICWGLLRKCIVADNCALIANAAFDGKLGPPSLPVLLLGTYAFAWQIYGDFSGYSDIARGSAKLMGFEFMVNFKQPYLAESLQDFWRRWHISLSTWLRDYLYIPLGGNRGGELGTYRNLLLTMLIGGLWHGANWTFVIWGAIHGGVLAIERFFIGRGERPGQSPAGGLARTFRRVSIFHLVCFAWIFFRAQSFTAALSMLAGAATWSWRPEFTTATILVAAFASLLFLLDHLLEARNEEYLFEKQSEWTRVAAAVGVCVILLLFTANQVNAFIYFQF